jgi:WD40 repeat protein
LWNLKQHQETARLVRFKGLLTGYDQLAFSPDSEILVAADSFVGISSWKVATGEHLGDFPFPGSYRVLSLSFSPDGKHLAVGRWYFSKQSIYDVATRKEIRQLDAGVGVLTYSADGRFLAGATGTGVVRVWDASTFKEIAGPKGHRGRVALARFAGNERMLTACPADKTYRFWEVKTGQEKAQFSLGPDPAYGVLLSPDGTLLAVNQWDGGPGTNPKKICVIEVATGKIRHTLDGGFSHIPLAFADKNALLIAGSQGKQIIVWDLHQGKEQRRSSLEKAITHQSGFLSAALTPDENALALKLVAYSSPQPGVLSSTNYVALIDWKNGKEQWSQRTEHERGALLFSQDGKLLFEDEAGIVHVRDRATGKVVRELAGRRPNEKFPWPYTSALAAFPDGKTLLTSNGRNRAYLWDIATGKELQSLTTHDGQIIALTVSPDGRAFATAGDDMTVLIWPRP